MDNTNNLFGIHAAALSLREARLNVLASNLANADTPNYKARDIDFAQALGEATRAAAHAGLTAGSPNTAAGAGPFSPLALPSIDDEAAADTSGAPSLPAPDSGAGKVDVATLAAKYRIPMQPSLDGNTVDSDVEHAAFSRAALDYKASLSFVAARAKTLMTAITGS